MNHFEYKRQVLHAEGVNLRRIARELGTPTYVYSRATLERHYRVMDAALSGQAHRICFSVKACSNLGVLDVLARLGSGFDVVSAGELERVRCVRGKMDRVVFSGVGKREDELAMALRLGIKSFNVESAGELALLTKVARKLGRVAPVSIRVNPDVDPKTHPYIATGMMEHKFGVPPAEARVLYAKARRSRYLRVCGVDCHIGSQLTETEPFLEALRAMLMLVAELRSEGDEIQHLDLGGGLGIIYDAERPPLPGEWGARLCALLQDDPGLEILVEPGRVIAGNAGILLTRVLYTKDQGEGGRRFVICDAGMNDLTRPALYGAHHGILPVREAKVGVTAETVDVVGPICESGDFLAQERPLPPIAPGDLLAVMSAGAYGFAMSSNYNSRPRAPEVIVDGKRLQVVRRRETLADLMRGEQRLKLDAAPKSDKASTRPCARPRSKQGVKTK